MKEISEPEISVAIILGATFALLGFFGGLAANFIWWMYLQTSLDLAFKAGIIALITFLFLCLFLLYYSNKQIKAYLGNKSENQEKPQKFG